MKIPPVVSDYTGTGANEKLGDLTGERAGQVQETTDRPAAGRSELTHLSSVFSGSTVYFSGSGSDKGIVFIPDIFGVTPQAIQVGPMHAPYVCLSTVIKS